MKRLCSLLLALSLLVSLTACGEPARVRSFDDDDRSQTEAVEPAASAPAETAPAETAPATTGPTAQSVVTPLLYKVTDSDGHVIWLFGSIHVGLDYYYPLPEYVLSAYEGADALAVECDIRAFSEDMSAQVSALKCLLYSDGTTISDYLEPEVYEKAVTAMEEYGMYSSAMDHYSPILWSSFIDSALYEELGVSSDLGIDMYFLNDAYDTGKEILEVESAQFQYEMMGSFSGELQALLLESSLASFDDPDQTEADLYAMMELWASGDEAAFAAYLTEETQFESEEEALLYAEYNDAMIVQRNGTMTDYAEEVLASGKEVFICVGAAHIVGTGAMADLLAQRGYTVELITP